MQLFCLPYAGGSRVIFKKIIPFLTNDIETHIIEYPGHGMRINEPYATSWKELIEDVKKQITSIRNFKYPFCILGYSMGAVIAYELIQYALEENPSHVFLCARGCGKNYDYPRKPKTEKEFQKELKKMGGLDIKICDNERLINFFARPAYIDYCLLSKYQYQRDKGNPQINLSIIYCEKDTPYEDVEEWKNRTNGEVTFYQLGENHFFINECEEQISRIINDTIKGGYDVITKNRDCSSGL